MNIELTAKGAAMRKSAKDAKQTWLAQAIAQLDEQERETLPELPGESRIHVKEIRDGGNMS